MAELPATVADAHAPCRTLGVFRFGLALLVMIQQAQALLPAWIEAAIRPLELGHQAISIFFMMSGFVIAEAATTSYAARPGAFLGNRLLRIMPSYVAALLLAAIVLSFASKGYVPDASESPTAHDRLAATTLAWNLLAPFPIWTPIESHGPGRDLIEQAWALRVAFAFYLAVAGALLLASVLRFSLAAVQTGVATLTLILLAISPAGLGATMAQNAPFFIFGIAYYHLVTQQEEQWFPASFCLAALAFIVAHLLGQAPAFGAAGYPRDRTGELIIVMILSAVFLVLARIDRRAGRGVIARFDRAIGDVAYPLCLFEGCVLVTARAWLPNHSWPSTYLAFGMAIAISVAAVLAIERPVARWRDRLRRPRTVPLGDKGVHKRTALP